MDTEATNADNAYSGEKVPTPKKKTVKKVAKAKKAKPAKKLGRKALTGAAALSCRLDLRVTKATKSQLSAHAKKKDQTISAVVIGLINKLK